MTTTSSTADRIGAAIAASDVLDDFTVNVRVSARRRTLGVTVEPGGDTLTVAVPADADPDDITAGLERMRDRLAAAVTRARKVAPLTPVKELVDGASFDWLGVPTRLRLLDGDAAVQRVHTNSGPWFHVGRDLLDRHGARPLIRWYCTEGTAWLEAQARELWPRMARPGAQPPALRVAGIGRKRWGKYEPDRHTATLAWQILQVRPALARYLVVHELAHATRPGGRPHGPEFWRAAERGMTGAREARRRLEQEGRSVWMGDIQSAPARR